jgi:LysR family transcriptional regulator, hca operon transcriptional activator
VKRKAARSVSHYCVATLLSANLSPLLLVFITVVSVGGGVIDNYFKRSGIKITPAHEADHVTMGISLIMSPRGVGMLPAYIQNFLPSSVTSLPLKGESPTVDLVLGYKKSNESPILKLLLSRLDELVDRVSKKIR